ncbi:hypothetical protein PsorP6_007093 [Peronosclerospora sorghi]|uniref:Uncharacterized protein n=1 Tax=Peronosclerospora sorghi TaxID=230839 RepID=A0ACC0WD76_9STRA|nr:hypothetical protein PsorP6_007093 [Peronosclerospora sorghi]
MAELDAIGPYSKLVRSLRLDRPILMTKDLIRMTTSKNKTSITDKMDRCLLQYLPSGASRQTY